MFNNEDRPLPSRPISRCLWQLFLVPQIPYNDIPAFSPQNLFHPDSYGSDSTSPTMLLDMLSHLLRESEAQGDLLLARLSFDSPQPFASPWKIANQ